MTRHASLLIEHRPIVYACEGVIASKQPPVDRSKAKANGLSYRDAGVDIDAGNALVDAIKPLARSTIRPGADSELGGFGGLFDLKAAGFKDPVLVAATDGVGTKLRIAIDAGRHESVGIDLVAMCVNDLVVQGAEPVFFLDYFATGRLSIDVAKDVVAGIAEGCRQSGAALIGGETAEMPGMYEDGDYDLAGFSVGAAERERLIDGRTIAAGDVILGLASSGVHSNGYSLVRRIVDISGLAWDAPAPFDPEETLAGSLITPTRIYVKSCLAALKADLIKGLVHITGGGFYENLPRVLPEGLGCALTRDNWPVLPVFDWLEKTGGVAPMEMHRTFNCGIGMAVFVSPENTDDAVKILEDAGEQVFTIGHVVENDGSSPAVTIAGIDS